MHACLQQHADNLAIRANLCIVVPHVHSYHENTLTSAIKFAEHFDIALTAPAARRKKVKSNYIIVCPKVDQRAGLLSLPHLGNFRRTSTFTTSAFTS